jgi:hypothetical protein
MVFVGDLRQCKESGETGFLSECLYFDLKGVRARTAAAASDTFEILIGMKLKSSQCV